MAHGVFDATDETRRENDEHAYLDLTRLVEEVPYVDEGERYYIWHGHKAVWHGPSKEAGEAWAAENGITIARFEPFEL